MARALAILVVLGALYVCLTVYSQGVDRAFGGAIAHLWKGDESKLRWRDEPLPRRPAPDSWEERAAPQPIGQVVRERVNRAMDEGARRHGGED